MDETNNHTETCFNVGNQTMCPIIFTDIISYIENRLKGYQAKNSDNYKSQYNKLFTQMVFDAFNCRIYSTKAISDTLPNVRTYLKNYDETHDDNGYLIDKCDEIDDLNANPVRYGTVVPYDKEAESKEDGEI